MTATPETKHVLIVGGGFAGLGCALELARSGGRVRVTLIDRHNYHQFQPLFYQLATSQLSVNDVSFSLRRICCDKKNIDIKLAEVAKVDPQTRSVHTKEDENYQGDYLVVAAGSQANFFRIPGADANTFPLYSLTDAERLRSRILALFEDTDRDPKLAEQGSLNFVIVGAGPTGTEMAGGLADMIHTTVSAEYADLAVTAARVYIVERGGTLLAPFSQRAHEYASKVLQRDGVQLRLNSSVTEVHPGLPLLDFPASTLWETAPTSRAPTAKLCLSLVPWPCRAASGRRRISWPTLRASPAAHFITSTKASWR